LCLPFQSYGLSEKEVSKHPNLFDPNQNVTISYNEKEVLKNGKRQFILITLVKPANVDFDKPYKT
jgi:hypothetical protein